MKKIILLAETGSDINKELATKYGIEIVPMHVSFGDETLDDASFPSEKICEYYKSTKKLPKTSGSVPADFIKVFDDIHDKHPEAHILYLAYSSSTTCSFQSATVAAVGRDYVTMIDTKQVSMGQAMIVVEMAKFLEANPDTSIEDAVTKANELISKAHMCFMPNNLEFLKAGGRVSNVAFLGSRLLSIHPCIELIDGKLVATKKYRGKMETVTKQMLEDYIKAYKLKKDSIWFIYTVGLDENIKNKLEEIAKEQGFKEINWLFAAGVITTHGGPSAFGLAGFNE